jgi:hypothetical protein
MGLKSTRRSEKVLRAFLSKEEAEELYADLRYYGRITVRDTVYNMMHRQETPLENFWENEDEFFADYFLLRKAARTLTQEQFTSLINLGVLPENQQFSPEELKVVRNKALLHRKSHCLYYFFESMPLYFAHRLGLSLRKSCVSRKGLSHRNAIA